MDKLEPDFIATSVNVTDRMVHMTLMDGSTHSFPAAYYPLLASAKDKALEKVTIRVGGRALRWEELDEDIWIKDAILQHYPQPRNLIIAEPSTPYPNPSI